MIRVSKQRLDDKAWEALVQRAEAERYSLVRAFRKDPRPKVNDALYKEYKAFLLAIFHHKCAYCETLISAAQPGDVEHFRPKGRVVGDDLKPVKVKYRKWGEIEHPGYFWLAYDWDNLLPSCIDCNRRRLHDDEGAGKADRFPVLGFRAALPGQERREQPLLVDPCKSDPAEHLEFNRDGTIRAKTPMGEKTLQIFGLNIREMLVAERRRAFGNANRLLRDFVEAVMLEDEERIEEIRPQINEIWHGKASYSAVQRLALEAVRTSLAKVGVELKLPLEDPAPPPAAAPAAGPVPEPAPDPVPALGPVPGMGG